MVAHVFPFRLSVRDIFVRCAAALVLTPVTLPQAPPVELVQSLFDLTPAEARVARSLAAGETVDAIATARGVSQNTIRDPSSRHLGKNRLPSSSRHRRAPQRNFPGAANTPGLTRRNSDTRKNLPRTINLDGAGEPLSSHPSILEADEPPR